MSFGRAQRLTAERPVAQAGRRVTSAPSPPDAAPSHPAPWGPRAWDMGRRRTRFVVRLCGQRKKRQVVLLPRKRSGSSSSRTFQNVRDRQASSVHVVQRAGPPVCASPSSFVLINTGSSPSARAPPAGGESLEKSVWKDEAKQTSSQKPLNPAARTSDPDTCLSPRTG